MKFKLLIRVFFVLLISPILAFLIYQLTDEKLVTWSSNENLTINKTEMGTFLSFKNVQIPESVQKNEEICEQAKSTGTQVEEFLSSWRDWEIKNKQTLFEIMQAFSQKPHQFSNSGLSSYQQEFKIFFRSAEIFDYCLCALRLSGRNQEADQWVSQTALNIVSQLNQVQPASYQLWALQTLHIYFDEEKFFLQNLKLNESLRAKVGALSQEALFVRAKLFSTTMVSNSLESLKSKGWRDLKFWLPAMLIHNNKLSNEMLNFEMDQEYKQASPQAHWTNVKNLKDLYFSLYVNTLKGSWEKIPSELANLKSLARP